MKNIATILLFLVIFFLGCETAVDIILPEERTLLVLNSVIVDGKYFSVNVSESKNILDEGYFVFVEGAKVEIFEEGLLITTLPDSLNGNYISGSFKAEKGKKYEVKVSKSGFETAFAETIIPFDTATILTVVLDTIPTEPGYYYPERLRFSVDIEDDGTKSNFYEIAVYSAYYYDRYDYSVDPPQFIDSVYQYQPMLIESKDPGLEVYQSSGIGINFNDELFNGRVHTLNLLADLGFYFGVDEDDIIPRTYYIVLRNTSESYYNYNISVKLQLWNSGNPFAQPVTVYNNIKNGYGILGAYNSVRLKVEN